MDPKIRVIALQFYSLDHHLAPSIVYHACHKHKEGVGFRGVADGSSRAHGQDMR
jgi:hypothetical protein